MSDEYGDNNDSEGIKSLRKQHDELTKQNKQLADELATFRAAQRKTTVAEVLKAKGLPEKAASLYSGDDVSEDAVGKWVEQYGDVFGIRQEGAPATQVADPNAEAAARVAAASFGAPQGADSFKDGQPIGDPEELLRLMTTLPYEKLVELGLQPKPTGLYGRGRG